jgi:hypothetical protein
MKFTKLDTIGPEIVDDFYTLNVLQETNRILAVLEPQKWEYFIDLIISHSHRHDQFLFEMGNEGWELVAVIEIDRGKFTKYYFKRPKVEK